MQAAGGFAVVQKLTPQSRKRQGADADALRVAEVNMERARGRRSGAAGDATGDGVFDAQERRLERAVGAGELSAVDAEFEVEATVGGNGVGRWGIEMLTGVVESPQQRIR